MRERMLKKLRSRKGETIAEALVSVLMIALCVLILAGAIETAARVNSKAEDINIEINGEENEETSFQVTVSDRAGGSGSVRLKGVTVYSTRTENQDGTVTGGYYYYGITR